MASLHTLNWTLSTSSFNAVDVGSESLHTVCLADSTPACFWKGLHESVVFGERVMYEHTALPTGIWIRDGTMESGLARLQWLTSVSFWQKIGVRKRNRCTAWHLRRSSSSVSWRKLENFLGMTWQRIWRTARENTSYAVTRPRTFEKKKEQRKNKEKEERKQKNQKRHRKHFKYIFFMWVSAAYVGVCVFVVVWVCACACV